MLNHTKEEYIARPLLNGCLWWLEDDYLNAASETVTIPSWDGFDWSTIPLTVEEVDWNRLTPYGLNIGISFQMICAALYERLVLLHKMLFRYAHRSWSEFPFDIEAEPDPETWEFPPLDPPTWAEWIPDPIEKGLDFAFPTTWATTEILPTARKLVDRVKASLLSILIIPDFSWTNQEMYTAWKGIVQGTSWVNTPYLTEDYTISLALADTLFGQPNILTANTTNLMIPTATYFRQAYELIRRATHLTESVHTASTLDSQEFAPRVDTYEKAGPYPENPPEQTGYDVAKAAVPDVKSDMENDANAYITAVNTSYNGMVSTKYPELYGTDPATTFCGYPESTGGSVSTAVPYPPNFDYDIRVMQTVGGDDPGWFIHKDIGNAAVVATRSNMVLDAYLTHFNGIAKKPVNASWAMLMFNYHLHNTGSAESPNWVNNYENTTVGSSYDPLQLFSAGFYPMPSHTGIEWVDEVGEVSASYIYKTPQNSLPYKSAGATSGHSPLPAALTEEDGFKFK